MIVNDSKKSQKVASSFVCNCGKRYKYDSGYYRHRNICTFKKENVTLENEPLENEDVLLQMIKQNDEFKQLLLEQNKQLMEQNYKILDVYKCNISQTNITNSNNNNTNNQFNVNMFLNEECKNAINIMDFVRGLKLTVEDIEETGRLGYVGGMTRIFVNALKDMDVKMRPIHCTDIKRETVYVKDQDSWEKDNQEKNKLKTALKQVAKKNLQLLPEWQQQNPDYQILDTPENQQYMQISLSSLGAYSDEDSKKQEDKILKNVLKEVVIDKKAL